MLSIFIIFYGCKSDTIDKEGLFIQKVKTNYQEYIDDGFESIPVDMIVLRKHYKEHILQVSFYKSLDTVSTKEWFFPVYIQTLVDYSIDSLLKEHDLLRVSPLCNKSRGFYAISRQENTLLEGLLLQEDSINYVKLTYYVPTK